MLKIVYLLVNLLNAMPLKAHRVQVELEALQLEPEASKFFELLLWIGMLSVLLLLFFDCFHTVQAESMPVFPAGRLLLWKWILCWSWCSRQDDPNAKLPGGRLAERGFPFHDRLFSELFPLPQKWELSFPWRIPVPAFGAPFVCLQECLQRCREGLGNRFPSAPVFGK